MNFGRGNVGKSAGLLKRKYDTSSTNQERKSKTLVTWTVPRVPGELPEPERSLRASQLFWKTKAVRTGSNRLFRSLPVCLPRILSAPRFGTSGKLVLLATGGSSSSRPWGRNIRTRRVWPSRDSWRGARVLQGEIDLGAGVREKNDQKLFPWFSISSHSSSLERDNDRCWSPSDPSFDSQLRGSASPFAVSPLEKLHRCQTKVLS